MILKVLQSADSYTLYVILIVLLEWIQFLNDMVTLSVQNNIHKYTWAPQTVHNTPVVNIL